MTEQDTDPADAITALHTEYHRLLYAMQSGVAYTMELEDAECTPKHLRVGVNSALDSTSAVTRLLMEKGLITEAEYFAMLNTVLREEVEGYEGYLSRKLGRPVRLG